MRSPPHGDPWNTRFNMKLLKYPCIYIKTKNKKNPRLISFSLSLSLLPLWVCDWVFLFLTSLTSLHLYISLHLHFQTSRLPPTATVPSPTGHHAVFVVRPSPSRPASVAQPLFVIQRPPFTCSRPASIQRPPFSCSLVQPPTQIRPLASHCNRSFQPSQVRRPSPPPQVCNCGSRCFALPLWPSVYLVVYFFLKKKFTFVGQLYNQNTNMIWKCLLPISRSKKFKAILIQIYILILNECLELKTLMLRSSYQCQQFLDDVAMSFANCNLLSCCLNFNFFSSDFYVVFILKMVLIILLLFFLIPF